ncbi:MAG: NADH-quinone oxidoreductase subunit G [Actinomycetaceae bacterium]|nr:NADH-quinone oxidoreductase subunit G [Actinomycetaceae bacterium]MDY6082691.1 NADH-quinone oxidoreductase subunit G [Actinomycetaceae bacterium]
MADGVTVTIDGKEITVPQGTKIIRAAEMVGVRVPRFCDHPLLDPVAACRQCLVEVWRPGRDGKLAKAPKPMPSCAEDVTPGMVVYSQATSEMARKAQEGMIDFLLVNHPLDCPICDKGGECPLQNQAMTEGRAQSVYDGPKRTYPKPLELTDNILLDRDRCILCQRCTRFADQIAGDDFIQLQGRGGGQPGLTVHGVNGSQIGNFDGDVLHFSNADGSEPSVYLNPQLAGPYGTAAVEERNSGSLPADEQTVEGKPFTSYFSGNIIQICPVGALTSMDYRFRSRPFDLVSVPGVTEHDASGAAIRVDYRRAEVQRRLAGEDAEVNEEWITDKDRFAFHWAHGSDRLTTPLVRDASGTLQPASWPEALDVAAKGLQAAKDAKGVGVLTGGRLPLEDAYAYSKFARVVLGTNDIDFRTRPVTDEENAFLASTVAGTGLGVTYTDVENAGSALIVALEPEDECGTLFLRLRKGARKKGLKVTVVAPYASRGTTKMNAALLKAAPGAEADVLDSLHEGDPAFDSLKESGIILVGERAGELSGVLSAVLRLADRTGARVAWVPRRAGDRAAIEAGALGTMLPAGRPVADAGARADTAAVWGVDSIPSTEGRSTEHMLRAVASGDLAGLVVAGVDLRDLPAQAAQALDAASFLVSFEVRRSAVAEYADVVFPVAPPVEKGGTFVNWEGRMRPFGQAITSVQLPDRIALNDLANAMNHDLGLATLADAVNEISEFDPWDGAKPEAPAVPASSVQTTTIQAGHALLASWNEMLGLGLLQDFEPHLAATAKAAVAYLSPATAQAAGITDAVTISTASGSVTVPALTRDMADGVVWIPQNSRGSQIATLGVRPGAIVQMRAADVEVAQ